MLLEPLCHSAHHLLSRLRGVIGLTSVQCHGSSDVLKCAELGVLSHYSGFLGLQDLIVALQLSVTLLKSGIRESTTTKVASNLLLLLIPRQLKCNLLFFTALLVKLSDCYLVLGLGFVPLGA